MKFNDPVIFTRGRKCDLRHTLYTPTLRARVGRVWPALLSRVARLKVQRTARDSRYSSLPSLITAWRWDGWRWWVTRCSAWSGGTSESRSHVETRPTEDCVNYRRESTVRAICIRTRSVKRVRYSHCSPPIPSTFFLSQQDFSKRRSSWRSDRFASLSAIRRYC